jgi:hypothetical protein
MTTILLAPGLLYLYFAAQGSNRASWRRIAVMALPFLGGLSVYLYLPIRASQLPVLNWGNPSTLERFLWHLSGKQYRVWIFSSTEAAGRQFQYFLSAIPREFVYIGLVFGLIGLLVLLRRNRRLFIGLIVMFVTCVLYSINYDIHDIDSYFLLAYITTAILGAVGMDFTARWIARRAGWRHEIGAVLMVLCGLVPLVVHYREVDESGDYLVEDYTKNMFASVEDNALILSYQWDYWVSASLYYQLVKGMRPDVMVVDKELLRRSWYFKELTERYPRLISRSKPEVDAFLAELYKFENELPYDPAVIQARYVAMIASFVSKTIQERPVYVTGEIEPEFTRGFQRVPEGLAFRLYPDAGFHPPEMPQIRYRPFPRRGRLEDLTRRLYSDAFLARGEYLVLAGNRGEAEQAVRTALEFDPTSSRARQWLSSLPK